MVGPGQFVLWRNRRKLKTMLIFAEFLWVYIWYFWKKKTKYERSFKNQIDWQHNMYISVKIQELVSHFVTIDENISSTELYNTKKIAKGTYILEYI